MLLVGFRWADMVLVGDNGLSSSLVLRGTSELVVV
jgi:hypothetical protein